MMERKALFKTIRLLTASALLFAGLFMVALWIRSHTWEDEIRISFSESEHLSFVSNRGQILCSPYRVPDFMLVWPETTFWQYDGGRLSDQPRRELIFHSSLEYPPSVYAIIPCWYAALAFGGMGIVVLRGDFSWRLLLILAVLVAVPLVFMFHTKVSQMS